MENGNSQPCATKPKGLWLDKTILKGGNEVKRVLVSVLLAVMVVATGATAFAADTQVAPAFSDISGKASEFELTTLAALGVYQGETGVGGTVKPDDNITRAQFAKVVVVASGKGSTAAGLAGLKPAFKDEIPTWAWGYVNVAVYMGIINGYPDGSFKANNPVTYAESTAMLIRSVSGHAAQLPAGVWPYNYIFYGVDNGFTGPVDVGFANLPATRGDIARMLYATMQVEKLNAKAETIGGQMLPPGRIITGLLTAYDLAGHTADIGGARTLGDKVYISGAASLEALKQLSVVAIADANNKIVAIGPDEAAQTVTGVYSSRDDSGTTDYLKLADGTKVAYGGEDTVATTINGDGGKTDADLSAGDEVTITLNESGRAAYILALHFEAATYLDGVTASKTTVTPALNTVLDRHTGADIEVPATASVMINGATASRDALAQWDVVYIAENAAGKAFSVRAIRQTIQGTPTAVWTSYTAGGTSFWATIGGKNYKTAWLLDAAGTYKLGLDKDGMVFVQINATAQTPFVVVKSYTEYSDHKTVTVDLRGVETTYTLAAAVAGDPLDGASATNQDYGKLTVDPLTGKINGWDRYAMGATSYYIAAVDAAHKTMTLRTGAGTLGDPYVYSFVSNETAVIYKLVSGSKVHLGFDGIAVGGHVKADTATGNSMFEYTAP